MSSGLQAKLRKLVKHPGPFWRDFLLKRYPDYLDTGPSYSGRTLLGGEALPGSVRHHDLELFPVGFPIDVVYTWVDGSDPRWLADKRKYQQALGSEAEAVVTTPARFACRGELRFSLRSLEQYAPWVRRIYVVTAGQRPDWLVDHGRLQLVDHREIIPERYLPTFNSHVIEAHLHRIEGLSEHYVYFNDDVLLSRPTPPEHLFAGNGNAHLFYTRVDTPEGQPIAQDTPTQRAAKNVRVLIEQAFQQRIRYAFAHTFHTQLRSIHEEIHARFADAIAAFAGNRFRSPDDLAMATYMFPNYAYLKGRADVRQTALQYFNIRGALAARHYAALLARRGTEAAPYSMCLNDVQLTGQGDEDFEAQEVAFLERYFPEPSPFERAGAAEGVRREGEGQ